ncbi:Zinc finger MYND domain-containing 19 Q7TSV3 [Chlorella sorokiniana]|uniref:Zinc finger MYND domain-containing 19 Q7TSV3 n=1 Tax=Chlorella sorokiniana TaxID=3076 RepID=A0A2P6TJP2_CHLSO|nr:Zinc finger MYND domain-containing 19 Q7TSV3 [Chlorella sorokiniana]|eukprot:PRW44306.1 Zinc finger MYND domain-containing 19 Q7TSV3 [Chlorella sorokiniana]
MASLALRLLGQVVAGLEMRHLGDMGAAQLITAALQLERTEHAVWTQMSRKQQSKLRELLRQLAERAQQLARRLTDAEVAADSLTVRTQVHATCLALPAGLQAMHELWVEPDEGYRLCGALALVLRAGAGCAAAEIGCWLMQLEAVCQVATLRPAGSKAALAFASTVAAPQALLPWMVAAARALDAETEWRNVPAGMHATAPQRFTLLASAVLAETRYTKHRKLLAANPGMARPLADYLLRRCLPAMAQLPAAEREAPADPTKTAAGELTMALTAPCLVAAVHGYMQQPAAAAAAAQQAAKLVQQLPAATAGNVDGPLASAYAHAAGLLAMSCYAFIGLEPPGVHGNAAAAGGSSGSGSHGGRVSGGERRQRHSGSQAGGGAATRSSSGGSGDASGSDDDGPSDRVPHMMAACDALLGALPQLAAFIEVAAAEGSALLQPVAGHSDREAEYRHVRQHNLAYLLDSLTHSLGLAQRLGGYLAHLPESHRWIDAAEAAVRLQPTLARLQRCPGLVSSPSLAGKAQELARALLRAVWCLPRPQIVPLGPLDDEVAAAQRASLGNRLWQLHSTSCRWVHSLLAEERQEPGRLAAYWNQSEGREWGSLWFHLTIMFLRAYDAMRSLDHGVEMGRTAAAQLAALCAAHWEAVQALAAAAAPSGGLVLAAENNFMVLLRAYHRIASTCPFLATPTFFHPLLGAVQQACNGSSVRAPMQGIVEALLPAADHPQVAAAAAFSGLLLLAADSAHAAATQDQPEAGAAIVGEWMNQIERVLLCLETAQAAAARRQAAQAAAARSCAYLACANMACTGGPGARQGEGSRKCSACRAVWYCGTACSHADWRAGHKRTCKALGASRQQEVQQGGKPGRTADAGAEEHCWAGSGFAVLGLKM